jgi:hypothetical protein
MPDAYVIEVGGRTAGIVAREPGEDSFGFYAAARAFAVMEGQRFRDPVTAEKAARRLAQDVSSVRRNDPAAPGS